MAISSPEPDLTSQPRPVDNETARLEAFSDGVFAIAITLLVLQMKPPVPDGKTPLVHSLVEMWPAYWGFVVSFLTILVMWINHHRIFRLVVKTDEWLLLFNGLLLLCITFIPFPTSVLAAHLQTHDRRTAVIFYTGTYVAIALLYNALWWCVAHRSRLIDSTVTHRQVQIITIQYLGGPILYSFAACLAYVNASLCLALTMIFAGYFMISFEGVVNRFGVRYKANQP